MPTPRRPGNPPAALDPARRREHIRCAALLAGGQFTGRRVAALFGISRSTAYRWRDAAVTYPEPEADLIREALGITAPTSPLPN